MNKISNGIWISQKPKVTLELRRKHFPGTGKHVCAEDKAALHFTTSHMRKKQNYSEMAGSMNLITGLKAVSLFPVSQFVNSESSNL